MSDPPPGFSPGDAVSTSEEPSTAPAPFDSTGPVTASTAAAAATTRTSAPLAAARAPSLQSLVERLAAVFAEGENKVEAMRARAEYFDRAGKVFDDDGDLFDSRMASFLEWYIIERKFRDGAPPALRVIADHSPTFLEQERRAAVHLATSHRSLFEVASIAGEKVQVDDLVGGARFMVVERRSTIGFEPGALFEARLLWNEDAVVFGKTFLFHPPDARPAVLRLADKAVDARTPASELLFQLSRLYVRWHRLGHLAAAKIYSGDG